jgi:Ca-activated chloride channel family protein
MASTASPTIETGWERRGVALEGDRAILRIRIRTAPAHQNPGRAPVDVAFALDRSGSMAGNPIQIVKKAVGVSIESLHASDRAALVVYDDQIDVIHRLQQVTPGTRMAMRRALDGVDARGSTNLCDGWLTACQQLTGQAEPRHNGSGPPRVRRSLLLTDGLANAGTTSLDALVTHAHELRRRGISTSTLGVGDGFDEVLLAGMAEAGGGNFQFIPSARALPDFFAKELGGLLSTVVVDLRVRLVLPAGVPVELISAFPAERMGAGMEVAVGDLPAGEETVLIFALETPPAADGAEFPVSIRCEWRDAATGQRRAEPISVDRLVAARPGSRLLTDVDDAISEQAALQHAARDQREAMRLDREGRYGDSRRLHQIAADRLAAAPRTGVVSERLQEAHAYASYDAGAPMPEAVRKQAVHQTMRRTRGRSDAS